MWKSNSNRTYDEKLQEKIDALLDRVAKAYPDMVIKSFDATNKTLSNRCGEIKHVLGFKTTQAFLEDYGFSYPPKIVKVKIRTDTDN